MKKFLLAVAVLLLLTVPCKADEAVEYATGPYVLGQIGAYGPSEEGKFSAYEIQSGYQMGLTLGYKINPMWAIQGELGYQQADGIAGYTYNAMPLTAAVRLSLPVALFTPYVLAGGGAYFVTTRQNGNAAPVDEVVIGGYGGLGGLFRVGKALIGGELRYQMTNIATAPNDGILALFSVGYEY